MPRRGFFGFICCELSPCLKWTILDFYGAVDPSKWRQTMEVFSCSFEARVAPAHAAHKILNGQCNSFMTFLWVLNWKRKHKLVLSIQFFHSILRLGSPAVQFIKNNSNYSDFFIWWNKFIVYCKRIYVQHFFVMTASVLIQMHKTHSFVC